MSSRGRAEGVVLRAAQCAMSRDLASREHPGPVCPVCQARIRYGDQMTTGRMEAFSDGVIAILITVMVLELPIPHGTSWVALRPAAPVLLTYLMSFTYLGIYWNNHHQDQRPDLVGQPAPVLAFPRPVHHGMAGREPLRGHSRGRLWHRLARCR